MKTLIILFALAFSCLHLKANNVSVSNVSYDGNTTITFDLSWENSWRTSSTQPYNYDGVWVFVKVRQCEKKYMDNPNEKIYYHAWLDPTSTNHTVPDDDGGTLIDHYVDTTNIGGDDRGIGVFIYLGEDVDSATNVSISSIQLEWAKAAQGTAMSEIDGSADYDVNVYAIEMVNVPEGAFYVGDRNTAHTDFHDSAGADEPFLINSEDAIYGSGTNYDELSYADDGEDDIAATFPKGYQAFWIMKYEITQYQYAEFLNTLSATQAQQRTNEDLETITEASYVMCNRTFSQGLLYRQGIILNPQGDHRTDKFYCNLDADNNYNESNDGLGLACNYLSVRDVMAYLDWAGLRPMTEFEYEKSCRGTKYPVQGEYAWGSVSLTGLGGIVSGGTPSERAINSESDGSANWDDGVFESGGPMRVGFAATANTNRVQAGCSYYGIMDLSGNVEEPYIGVYYDPGTDAGYSSEFNGQNGDGMLASDGQHDVTHWPQASGTNDHNRFISKGGHWNDNNDDLRVSRRYDWREFDDNTDGRNQYYGGRGGRTDYR